MVPLSEATALHAPSQHEESGQAESVETLIRRAHKTFEAAGLAASPSKVSTRVRAQIRKRGIESAARMIESYATLSTERGSFEAYCLTYADPVGELATHNVMAASR